MATKTTQRKTISLQSKDISSQRKEISLQRKSFNKKITALREQDERLKNLDPSVIRRIKSHTELPKTISAFVQDIIDNAMSKNTAKEYGKEIMRFSEWKTKHFGDDLTSFTRDDVKEYKDFIKNTLNNTATTMNRKIAALKKYNEFLIEQNLMDKTVVLNNDFISIQVQYANPTTITENDVNDFMRKVGNTQSYRNYAIASVLVYCGLRISECLGLELNFVDLDNNELTVRNGKGNKERTVYMNSRVVNAIKDYIKYERNSAENHLHKNSKYLFISRQSDKLTTQSVHVWMKECMEGLHPHLLRHFFCSNALKHGFDLSEIMNQAGHSNVQTTMRYTNPTATQMKLKMEKL